MTRSESATSIFTFLIAAGVAAFAAALGFGWRGAFASVATILVYVVSSTLLGAAFGTSAFSGSGALGWSMVSVSLVLLSIAAIVPGLIGVASYRLVRWLISRNLP